MQAALAKRRVRTIAWSRPGYGGSTRLPGRSVADVAADTAAVLDALGIEQAFVAGWSGGGPHALACAALFGDRVRATAVIAGVAPYPAEGLDWSAGMGAENIEEFGAAVEGPEALIGFKERAWPVYRAVTGAEVAAAFGDLIDDVDRGSLTSVFAEDVARSFRDGLRNGYWGWFDDDLAFVNPWGFDLAAITGPVHVWQGEHDRMVPFAHGQWLTARIPGAVPHLHPDQGHLSLVVGSFDRILGELFGP
jgi:pimeloyl-ACP methyl ester carboxylesterase